MADTPLDQFDALYKAVGTRILAARRARGRNQTELSTAVGLCRASISNIEAGRQRVGLHTLMLIAAYLQVGVAELMGVDGDPASPAFPMLDAALTEQLRRGAHAQGWNDCAVAMRAAIGAVQYPQRAVEESAR